MVMSVEHRVFIRGSKANSKVYMYIEISGIDVARDPIESGVTRALGAQAPNQRAGV